MARGGSGAETVSSTASSRASSPSPRPAEAPTTGTPSRADRASRSTRMPRRSASSSRLTHTTVRGISPITWRARISPRSRQVASHTTTAPSAPPELRKSRATTSSAERASRE